jgi:hypothetical protein
MAKAAIYTTITARKSTGLKLVPIARESKMTRTTKRVPGTPPIILVLNATLSLDEQVGHVISW